MPLLPFEQAKPRKPSFIDEGVSFKAKRLWFIIFVFLMLPLTPSFSLSTTQADAPTLADALFVRGVSYLGSPYLLGGRNQSGFDCSGLVWAVFHKLLGPMPTGAEGQARLGHKIPLSQVQPGDLIFFATGRSQQISHVALYLGNDTLLHAVSEGWPRGVVLSSLSEHYWKTRVLFARRLSWPQGTTWETPGKIYRIPYVKGWYQGPLLNGLPEGKGFLLFRNGDTFVGSFHSGLPQGEGVYHWRNGAWFKGRFESGIRTGEGVYQPCHGPPVRAFWSNDQPQKVEQASFSLLFTQTQPRPTSPSTSRTRLLPATQFVLPFHPEALFPRSLVGRE